MMALLNVSNISRTLSGNEVLHDITFTQERGERIGLAGVTGSGKTTLLKVIAGLVQPNNGNVVFDGRPVLGPEYRLLPGHEGIAYLSQHFELRNNYRVEEILEYANTRTEAEAAEIFEACRITHLLKRGTEALSGGERQRVALARLLIGAPKLLLLDEPFSNLDVIHKKVMKDVLDAVEKRFDITFILVSHDGADLLSWADRLMVLQQGHFVQDGRPETIYNNPVNLDAAMLLGQCNEIGPAAASQLSVPVGALLRPEWLLLSNGGQGSVSASRYFGSYYEFDILVENETVIVRANEKFSTGNSVSISLKRH